MRVRSWALIAGVVAVLVTGGVAALLMFPPYTFTGTVIQSPDPAPDFTLEGSNSEAFTLSDYRGQAVVLYFGYTYCPDVCPTSLINIDRALGDLGRLAADVQVVLISVDPERDTLDVLDEYVTYFNEDFLGVTGSPEEISRVATLYGVYYERHDEDAAGGYLIDHTATIAVIDEEGHLKLLLPPEASAEAIAGDLRHILR